MASAPAFVITLDTEPDNEWGRPRVPTTHNARFIPRFHELCVTSGLKVTYLMTLEMAEDDYLREYLRPRLRAGECEVGAHLHPWNTPPIVAVTDDDFQHHPYPFEYPVEVQRDKLHTLVTAIERHYGVRPLSYKAGRWGLDGAHAQILDDFGFVADTSVCPGINWGPSKGDPRRSGGPDFSRAPHLPYRLSADDVCRAGSLRVWEVPPTIVFYSALGRYLPGVRALYARHRRVRRLFDRQHLGSQWLRPYPHMTVARLARVIELARRSGTPVLNCTFHSSELMPGGSPYNRTEASIENLFERLTGFVAYVRQLGLRSATLSEACAHLA
ncbi:MAG TPA: hypothetical protein VMW17_24300 [Candidatus Binatia bacterium]|nr:hypothetical protein [Candidatus Binatia bacterium]